MLSQTGGKLSTNTANPPLPHADGAAGGRTISVARPMDMDTDSGASIWRVESGQVDVFLVVERDGSPRGNRHFVRSAGPGDLLFAIEPAQVGWVEGNVTGRLRVFTGAEASLVPFDPKRAPKMAVMAGIDAWLMDFGHAVVHARDDRQAGGRAVVAGDETSFPAGTRVKSARDVVWVEATDGRATLFGDPKWPCLPSSPMPLAGGSWAVALEETVLRVFDTQTLLDLPGWIDHLTAYQSASLGILTETLLASFSDEDRRIAQSSAGSRKAYATAIAGFAGVLGTTGVAGQAPTHEDPLASACRAVAQALGFEMSRMAADESGSAAGMLERIVRCSGLPAREVTLYKDWWRDEIGPMVGFVRETGSPVALLPAGRGRYRIYDPVSGQSEALDPPQAGLLGRSAFVLYPSLPDRPLTTIDLLRFGLQPSAGDIGVVLGMGAIGALLSLGVPIAIGVLIDDLIPSHLRVQLLELGLLLAMVALTQLVTKIAGNLAQLRIFGRAGTRLQTAIFDRTLRLSTAFLNQFSSADLAQRTLVVDTVRRLLSVVVVDALLAGVFSLSSLICLLVLGPAVALVAILVFGLFLGASVWAGLAQTDALTESEAKTARASELAFQFVDNIAQLRAAGAEERAYAKWATVYAAMQSAALRANKVVTRFASFSAGYEIFALAVFFATVSTARSPNHSTGDLLTMITVYALFIASSSELGVGIQRVFLILPKFRRAQVLLRAIPEISSIKDDPGKLSGRIEVSHLTFGYTEAGPPILRDISLTIQPGELVAFVGASGSGKSTMMKLLLGFEQPSAGSIFFEGHDLKKLDLRAVRRQIGVVLQDGELMAGSIGENILGVTGGTNEQAWAAARGAGLAEDIERMPMGMHTVLTEGATTLSGGQAQRLLIARALVGEPRMMFLDEATSALDNHTQATVMHSLQQMAGTRIVVAHRLSTIERADRIYVFDAGRIVQAGTFAELARTPGPFADLAQRQMQ